MSAAPVRPTTRTPASPPESARPRDDTTARLFVRQLVAKELLGCATRGRVIHRDILGGLPRSTSGPPERHTSPRLKSAPASPEVAPDTGQATRPAPVGPPLLRSPKVPARGPTPTARSDIRTVQGLRPSPSWWRGPSSCY